MLEVLNHLINNKDAYYQVYRDNDIGAAAAQSFTQAAARGTNVENIPLGPSAGAAQLAAAVARAESGDALVLWLRPEDLRRLPAAGSAAAASQIECACSISR